MSSVSGFLYKTESNKYPAIWLDMTKYHARYQIVKFFTIRLDTKSSAPLTNVQLLSGNLRKKVNQMSIDNLIYTPVALAAPSTQPFAFANKTSSSLFVGALK